MGLKEDIIKNNVVLVVIPSENYNDVLLKIVKQALNHDKTCYVTLSKGYDALTIFLEKNKIKLENFSFIDTITKTVKAAKDTSNCIFVSSPNALTELSLAITKTVQKQKSRFVIIDSLSTLLIYHKDDIVSKFVQNLSNKFGTTETNLIFTMAAKDKESDLFKNIPLFVNKIIEL